MGSYQHHQWSTLGPTHIRWSGGPNLYYTGLREQGTNENDCRCFMECSFQHLKDWCSSISASDTSIKANTRAQYNGWPSAIFWTCAKSDHPQALRVCRKWPDINVLVLEPAIVGEIVVRKKPWSSKSQSSILNSISLHMAIGNAQFFVGYQATTIKSKPL